MTFLPRLSRLGAPTPKPSQPEDKLPEDYPVVRNMLHRLAGKGAGRCRSAPFCLKAAEPSGRRRVLGSCDSLTQGPEHRLTKVLAAGPCGRAGPDSPALGPCRPSACRCCLLVSCVPSGPSVSRPNLPLL